MGSSIIEELQSAGKFEINCITRKKNENSKCKLVNNVKIIQGDVSEYKALIKLEKLEKIETIVHAAGLAHQFGKTVRDDFWRTNVLGTENICRLAELLKVRHLILISSVSVYGNHGNIEIDESIQCQPEGFYAESKLEAERKAIKMCQKTGIKLTILRLSTVIGEGDVGNFARLITQIDKKRFIWIGKGNNKKSLIYKKDVAKAVLRLVENHKEIGVEIFNLSSEAISMKEIVEAISRNLSKSPLKMRISEQFIRKVFRINARTISNGFLNKTEQTVEKWLSNDIFSGKKLYDKYGFTPQTPISEAISRQVKYYLEKKMLRN